MGRFLLFTHPLGRAGVSKCKILVSTLSITALSPRFYLPFPLLVNPVGFAAAVLGGIFRDFTVLILQVYLKTRILGTQTLIIHHRMFRQCVGFVFEAKYLPFLF